MNEREFRSLAATFGAEIERWPERHRAEAVDLLATQAWAVDVIADAARLDDVLSAPDDGIDPARVDHAIAGVNARVAALSQQGGLRDVLWRWLAPATGLLAAGLFGIWLGGGSSTGGAEAQLAELLQSAIAFADPSFLTVVGG